METIYMNEVHWNKTKEKPTNNLEGEGGIVHIAERFPG